MTASTASGPSNPEDKGLTAEALRLFGSITRHLQALVALAGLEGREALALYVRLAIVLGASLFFAAFGYIFLVLFVAFAIAYFSMWNGCGSLSASPRCTCWERPIGGFYLKKHFRTPIFRATSEKFARTPPRCAEFSSHDVMKIDDLRLELDATRRTIRSDYSALRHELDFAGKAKRAVAEHPFPWLGGAAILGFLFSGRRRRKEPRRKGGKPGAAESAKRFSLLGLFVDCGSIHFPDRATAPRRVCRAQAHGVDREISALGAFLRAGNFPFRRPIAAIPSLLPKQQPPAFHRQLEGLFSRRLHADRTHGRPPFASTTYSPLKGGSPSMVHFPWSHVRCSGAPATRSLPSPAGT